MPSFGAIANEACRIAAAALAVNLAKAMRYEDGALHFVAAVGWSEADRERIVFPADDSNPAGFAFQSRQPVTSNNLHAEGRFRTCAACRQREAGNPKSGASFRLARRGRSNHRSCP